MSRTGARSQVRKVRAKSVSSRTRRSWMPLSVQNPFIKRSLDTCLIANLFLNWKKKNEIRKKNPFVRRQIINSSPVFCKCCVQDRSRIRIHRWLVAIPAERALARLPHSTRLSAEELLVWRVAEAAEYGGSIFTTALYGVSALNGVLWCLSVHFSWFIDNPDES